MEYFISYTSPSPTFSQQANTPKQQLRFYAFSEKTVMIVLIITETQTNKQNRHVHIYQNYKHSN